MLTPLSNRRSQGFTLAEVAVAMAIAVIFAGATFATNQRLLFSLKSQKETTAATMMLQERMESFRGLSYSNLADSSYITTNVAGGHRQCERDSLDSFQRDNSGGDGSDDVHGGELYDHVRKPCAHDD